MATPRRALDFSAAVGTRSRFRAPQTASPRASSPPRRSAANVAEPLSFEERSAVESYVNYRLKLASHPLASAAGSAAPYSPEVRAIADSVLECELKLLEVRLENVDDELAATVEQHETARIATMRLREALALERMKLSGTHGFISKARDIVFEASKRKEHAAAARKPTTGETAVAGADDSNGSETRETVLDISTDVTLRRARLQDALSSACDVCPTVVYPTVMESLSQLAQTRRRVDYEKKWSDEVRAQLDRIQMEMAKTRSEEEERKDAIARAKNDLDDAHRDVFTKRKQYIVAHKRLMGQDRLPDGSTIRPDDAKRVIDTIREELRAGRTDTLDRLATSDCAELMGRHAAAGARDRASEITSRTLLGTPRASTVGTRR